MLPGIRLAPGLSGFFLCWFPLWAPRKVRSWKCWLSDRPLPTSWPPAAPHVSLRCLSVCSVESCGTSVEVESAEHCEPLSLSRTVKLCVIELENHNPFSSCFSLSLLAPFTVGKRQAFVFFKKLTPHLTGSWYTFSG